jgi:hypothetical protein
MPLPFEPARPIFQEHDPLAAAGATSEATELSCILLFLIAVAYVLGM